MGWDYLSLAAARPSPCEERDCGWRGEWWCTRSDGRLRGVEAPLPNPLPREARGLLALRRAMTVTMERRHE
jgi:hypothetical protein